jgi:hypothetical protein
MLRLNLRNSTLEPLSNFIDGVTAAVEVLRQAQHDGLKEVVPYAFE